MVIAGPNIERLINRNGSILFEGGQKDAVFHATVEVLISRDKHLFSPESYAFVLNSVAYAFEHFSDDQSVPQFTTRQLIEACHDYAKTTWGSTAKEILRSWGITSFADVGEIVKELVKAGILRKRPEDTLEEFKGHPFFED